MINVTTESMSDHIEVAAIEFPGHVSESEIVGWHAMPSQMVKAPSVAESPAAPLVTVFRPPSPTARTVRWTDHFCAYIHPFTEPSESGHVGP